ncbi:hypothetical protein [Chitinophaga rupis]|uniref:hypothetical protein n=1 Tax=Chitinophaga rupis TaxID=573321 RepID=UPI0011602197|nr:hypothetical protein [Chitinophaga rupis]
MRKQWLHKIFAIILLGVFALHTTPREFIHLFAPHEDTIDDCGYKGNAFSIQHKHCEFLQIGVEPYEQITFHYEAPSQSVTWVYTLPHIPAAVRQRFADASLRAPPAKVC